MELAVSFYPAYRVWFMGMPQKLVEKPKSNPSDISPEEFMKFMREIVVEHSSKDVSIRLCRDGMILLNVHELDAALHPKKIEDIPSVDTTVKIRADYLYYSNAFLVLLEFLKLNCTPENMFRSLGNHDITAYTQDFEECMKPHVKPFNVQLHSYNIHWHSRYLQTYDANQPLEKDNRISSRVVYDKDYLWSVINTYDALCVDRRNMRLLGQLAVAYSSFYEMNFSTSLIISSFLLEEEFNKLLNQKSRNHRIQYKQVLKKLKDEELIDEQTYKEADRLREMRNAMVHEMLTPNSIVFTDCVRAFRILQRLIEQTLKVKCEHPIGFGFTAL